MKKVTEDVNNDCCQREHNEMKKKASLCRSNRLVRLNLCMTPKQTSPLLCNTDNRITHHDRRTRKRFQHKHTDTQAGDTPLPMYIVHIVEQHIERFS